MKAAERQQHLDPYQVHKENMEMLKVLPISGNRSAPNSPMLRRANSGEKLGQKSNLLSPNQQRKEIKQVAEENRSISLTHLAPNSNENSPKNLSPGGSPVGSPLTVSERIIRTHFLSNTTGKPGSYLLKKSDEIIRQKESPIGSPRMPISPRIQKKDIISTEDRNQSLHGVAAHSVIPIVILPGVGESKVGFEVKESNQVNKKDSPSGITKDNDISCQKMDKDQSISDMKENEEQQIENIRESIGLILSKPKPVQNLPEKGQGAKAKTKESKSSKKKGGKKKEKPKRHHYIKYGNLNQSPGLLSPPAEPRGSKDLTAEMETWKRTERRLFNDLEHLEEISSLGQSDESISSLEGTKESDKMQGQTGVFVMPHVHENVVHNPETRDFSIPLDIKDNLTPEEWEEIKRCRYIRKGNDSEGEIDEDLDEQVFSDDDDDDDEEDNN